MKLIASICSFLLGAGYLVAQTKGAIVSGKVMDADGDPVENAFVELLSDNWFGGALFRLPGRRTAMTDDRGQYRISNLPATKYYLLVEYRGMPGPPILMADGKPQLRPWPTYYQQAATLAASTPLIVEAGQALTDVNIVMRSGPVYHIRGKVMSQPDLVDPYRLWVNGEDAEGRVRLFAGGSTARRDGTFDVPDIPPGKYVLQVFHAGLSWATQNVTVVGADVNGVVLTKGPDATIQGQIVFEGTPHKNAAASLTQATVDLGPGAFSAASDCDSKTHLRDDLTFTFEDVTPGTCDVYFGAGGSYMKSVAFDGRSAAGRKIEITPGVHTLKLTASYDGGWIQGKVKDLATGPVPKATAVLASEIVRGDGSGVYFAPYVAGGTFAFRWVAPGKYRAYALEDFGSWEWNRFQDPEFRKQILSKGIVVEVTQGDQKMIEVPLIPASEVDQLLKP